MNNITLDQGQFYTDYWFPLLFLSSAGLALAGKIYQVRKLFFEKKVKNERIIKELNSRIQKISEDNQEVKEKNRTLTFENTHLKTQIDLSLPFKLKNQEQEIEISVLNKTS